MDTSDLAEYNKPYDPNSQMSKYIRKIVRAKKCVKAVNPKFIKAMDTIRENFGRDWKYHQEKGSFDAWDNAILAYYNKLPEDKQYPGGLE